MKKENSINKISQKLLLTNSKYCSFLMQSRGDLTPFIEGVERSAFLPGEQGQVHVDYTLDAESDKDVVVRGRLNGPKEPRGKWRTFLERQKNLKQLRHNGVRLLIIVDNRILIL